LILENQRPPKVSVAEWLLVAALGVFLFVGTAHGQTVALQPGNAGAKIPLGQRGSTRITEAELRKVEGLTIRLRPEWLWHADAKGNYKWDFTVPDANITLCRKLGKKYTLLLMGGGPQPLDPYSRGFYASAARELGKRYSADPLCYAVHVTGASPPGHSEEQFWRPMPPLAIVANKGLIYEWATAFPRQLILFAGAGADPKAMREMIRYGVEIAPGRFVYKINSLSAKTPTSGWVGTDLVVEAAKAGAGIGFEMLDNSSASRFGGTFAQSMAKMAALEKRAGVKTSYLAIYRGDIAKAGAK
jgi:hypothetical protein